MRIVCEMVSKVLDDLWPYSSLESRCRRRQMDERPRASVPVLDVAVLSVESSVQVACCRADFVLRIRDSKAMREKPPRLKNALEVVDCGCCFAVTVCSMANSESACASCTSWASKRASKQTDRPRYDTRPLPGLPCKLRLLARPTRKSSGMFLPKCHQHVSISSNFQESVAIFAWLVSASPRASEAHSRCKSPPKMQCSSILLLPPPLTCFNDNSRAAACFN